MEINQYLLLMLTIYSLYQLSKKEIYWIYSYNNMFSYIPQKISNIEIYSLKAKALFDHQLNIYLNSYIFYSFIVLNYMFFLDFGIKQSLTIFILINLIGMTYTHMLYVKEYFNALEINMTFNNYLANAFLSQKIEEHEILDLNDNKLDQELNLINFEKYEEYIHLFNKYFDDKYTPLNEIEFSENIIFMKHRLFAKIDKQLFFGISLNNKFIIYTFNTTENYFSEFLKKYTDIEIKKYENYYIYMLLILILTFIGSLK